MHAFLQKKFLLLAGVFEWDSRKEEQTVVEIIWTELSKYLFLLAPFHVAKTLRKLGSPGVCNPVLFVSVSLLSNSGLLAEREKAVRGSDSILCRGVVLCHRLQGSHWPYPIASASPVTLPPQQHISPSLHRLQFDMSLIFFTRRHLQASLPRVNGVPSRSASNKQNKQTELVTCVIVANLHRDLKHGCIRGHSIRRTHDTMAYIPLCASQF